MTAFAPIVTVPEEGGYYSQRRTDSAPIRIYPDRWLEDDIAARVTGKKRKKRLSRREFRLVRKYARENTKEGRV